MMRAWLENVGYPLPLTDEDLASSIRARVEIGGDTAAYVWAAFVPGVGCNWCGHEWSATDASRCPECGHNDLRTAPQTTLCFHGCAAPEYRGRWLAPAVMSRLFVLAELVGATALYTAPVGPHAPALARMYRRLGFYEEAPGEFITAI